MAVQNIKWLAENIETDELHRLVTDEQIKNWDGSCEVITDWNAAITSGLYVSDSTASNQPDTGENFLGEVVLNASGDKLVQSITEISNSEELVEPSRYIRKASKVDDTWTFGKWYVYGLTKVETLGDKAARILQDFNYVIDSETKHVILTEWKETLNGEPSTELVVPDTDEIQIEI